jgi:hypothetical protein
MTFEEQVGDLWVGDVWRELQLHSGRTNNLLSIERLIYKLVEERKKLKYCQEWIAWIANGKQGASPSMIMDVKDTLREFGIPEETWSKYNESKKESF